MAREDDALAEVLVERLRAAAERARALIAHSELMRSATRLRREDGELAKHCAWCGRISLGGHWMAADNAPSFIATAIVERATHTICEECVRALEETGRSVRP